MKKYLRRIGALLLSFIMVLSVCTSVFAATKNTATITVNNAEGAILTYVQVIEPDQTTETGWNFVKSENDAVANAYIEKLEASDAQDAIQKMIDGVSADKLGAAQALAASRLKLNFANMANPQEVNVAGVYLIRATDPTGEETGKTTVKYTYNIMAAYVGFGEVTIEKDGAEIKYDYPSLKDTTVDAKKTPISVTKTVDDSDNVTRTGAELTYTVTTNVPFIEPTDTDKSFWVYDELTGAEYVDLTAVTIKLAGEDVSEDYTIIPDSENPKTKFSVDLSSMINAANSNAGSTVVIEYTVKVTSANDTITNTAKAGHVNGEQYGSTTITTYEGNITLTKYGEDDSVKLKGAGFEVRRNDKASAALKFVKISDGVYKFDPAGDVTMVETKDDGTVKIQGLDVGTYYFKEIKAPKGYSRNANDAEATLEVGENEVASAILTDTTTMNDTKLSDLPSTGGIGTYIFTITGVLIMVGVAGMFIISRRKEHE